ncbi:MAG: aspartate carbamoyltransferase regulatory subunit [Bacteroidales bacterium]|jgi:aspartate carbamoyltransferase regulatory subunit|nr:aspartate carbamoyltransferase regulatory subunit [Bacteroidales bacterium]
MSDIQGGNLIVSAIQNGTVIDHIPSNRLFEVISILRLETIATQVTFCSNLGSKTLGKKAIIKISDKFFKQDEINKIAILVPQAKLNIIRDYKVVEKKMVTLPDEITGITKCFNPMCITNHQPITQRFKVVANNPTTLQCFYCERTTDEGNFNLL